MMKKFGAFLMMLAVGAFAAGSITTISGCEKQDKDKPAPKKNGDADGKGKTPPPPPNGDDPPPPKGDPEKKGT